MPGSTRNRVAAPLHTLHQIIALRFFDLGIANCGANGGTDAEDAAETDGALGACGAAEMLPPVASATGSRPQNAPAA